MKNPSQEKQVRYDQLRRIAIYNVTHNLLFMMHHVPREYYKHERRGLIDLVDSGSRTSLERVLRVLRERYRHCPAKAPIECMLREYH